MRCALQFIISVNFKVFINSLADFHFSFYKLAAGRVVYAADGFLEKNKNFLPAEVIQLVRQSQYDMIRFLFQCPITKTGNLYSAFQDTPGTKITSHSNLMRIDTKVSNVDLESSIKLKYFSSKERFNSRGLASQSRAQQTVATYFRFSLMDLLQKMVSGTPQFVRCIKPNDIKAPKCFEASKVIKQLRFDQNLGFRQFFLTFSSFLKGTLEFWRQSAFDNMVSAIDYFSPIS
jgi:myosin heavy subunit